MQSLDDVLRYRCLFLPAFSHVNFAAGNGMERGVKIVFHIEGGEQRNEIMKLGSSNPSSMM